MKKIPQNMNILFIVLKMRPPPPPKKKNTANAALKTNRETYLFVCFFEGYRPTRDGDVTITGEGLLILT